MRWFDNHYLKRPEDRATSDAAPLRAKDFGRLPPAYVLTAQYHPLRDEGEELADKLAAAGVPVVKKRYSNMIHAFPGLLLNVVPEAAEELVIGGGIAAYKSLELIRRLAERGVRRAILTDAGAEFVTPLSVSALTREKVYSELFSLTDESRDGTYRIVPLGRSGGGGAGHRRI